MSPEPVKFRLEAGGYNGPSASLFKKIPWEVRRAIALVQLEILSWVYALCPSAVVTSSFRSPGYTVSLYSGRGQTPNYDSLHAWGAIDFRRSSVDPALLLEKSRDTRFRVVDEPKNGCVHVEIK